MATIPADQPLLPSVLDRLLDDEPDVRRDPAPSPHQLLRTVKQAVRRDLQNLLNTRRRCLPTPPNLAELDQSLVEYGMPDFTEVNMGSGEGRGKLRELLESVIRRCEPRLKSVAVHLLDNEDPLDRTLRFRIDGLLHAVPAPEPVAFDTTLETATGTIEVRGVNR
jgi:type VI secretion system protein ImpF